MALLHVFGNLAGPLQISPVAVYVDHGLRPGESGAEAELVRSTAASLHIPCRIGSVNVSSLAEQQGLSIEDAARQLRYEVLNDVAEEYGANTIAIAHTADDQSEEILIRLIRGSGRKGLSGMETFRQSAVLRPFLKTTKKELIDYLQENNISFLKDSSNRDRTFLRNRVRLDLIPFLAEHFNENIDRTLLQTADILREEEELLENICRQEAVTVLLPPSPDAPPGTLLSLDLDYFSGLAKAIRRRLLEKAFLKTDSRPQFRVIEQILAMIVNKDRGTTIHGSRGLRIIRQDSRLHFSYPGGMDGGRGNLGGEASGSFSLLLEKTGRYEVEPAGIELYLEVIEKSDSDYKHTTNGIEYLDLNTVTFPLILRSARPGDRFRPINGTGNKKISDFLTDLKIPKHQRRQVPVLESDGQVAAIIGLRIADPFKVTDNTREVLSIRWRPLN